MPEIEEECKFYTRADQARFETRTNGDRLSIRGFHLDQGQAASLAWLINKDSQAQLEFQVKVKT